MARPIRISRSNYFILLIPDIVSMLRSAPDDVLPESLLKLIYEPAGELATEIGLKQYQETSTIEVDVIIMLKNPEMLDKYLTKGGQKLIQSRYLKFLESIVESIIEERSGGDNNQASSRSTDKIDFALDYYRNKIYQERIRRFTTAGIVLAEEVPDSLQVQIFFAASGYADYLEAIHSKGKSKLDACTEIEERDIFKKNIIQNIRQDYHKYDSYFERLETLIDKSTTKVDGQPTQYPFRLTDKQKAELISHCAGIAGGIPNIDYLRPRKRLPKMK